MPVRSGSEVVIVFRLIVGLASSSIAMPMPPTANVLASISGLLAPCARTPMTSSRDAKEFVEINASDELRSRMP